MHITRNLAIALASAGLCAGLAAPAHADVERRIDCSAGSRLDIDVDRARSQYKIDVEVITEKSGESWRLVATKSGTRIHSSTRMTQRDGDDRYADADWIFTSPRTQQRQQFTFRAENRASGEICRITVRA